MAAGEGNEVGGDFYDCFATGGGDWALVIGDVCGKGAEAATLTALARYTLRAAAQHTRRPQAVLRELNEALLRHQLGYRFCTVLYASLTPHDEPRDGLRGHRRPSAAARAARRRGGRDRGRAGHACSASSTTRRSPSRRSSSGPATRWCSSPTA